MIRERTKKISNKTIKQLLIMLQTSFQIKNKKFKKMRLLKFLFYILEDVWKIVCFLSRFFWDFLFVTFPLFIAYFNDSFVFYNKNENGQDILTEEALNIIILCFVLSAVDFFVILLFDSDPEFSVPGFLGGIEKRNKKIYKKFYNIFNYFNKKWQRAKK